MYCMHSCGRFGISSAPAAPGVSKPVPSQCPVSDVRAVVVRESAVVHRQPASAARTTTHLQRQPSTEHNTSDDVFTTLPGPPYVLASAPVRLKQLHRGRRLKHSGVSPSFLQTFLLVYNFKKSGQIIQNFLHNLHLYSCRTDRNNIFIISNNSFYFFNN